MKKHNPEEFFKKIALNSGISDMRTIKDLYYGLIRTLSRELKATGNVQMPDWGTFGLKIHKSRRSLDVNTGKIENLGPKPTIKFISDRNVKHYFYSLMDFEL